SSRVPQPPGTAAPGSPNSRRRGTTPLSPAQWATRKTGPSRCPGRTVAGLQRERIRWRQAAAHESSRGPVDRACNVITGLPIGSQSERIAQGAGSFQAADMSTWLTQFVRERRRWCRPAPACAPAVVVAAQKSANLVLQQKPAGRATASAARCHGAGPGRTPVIPGAFAYHRPDSLGEAVALLANLGEEARPLAGGHSLIPMMKLRLATPEHLVDLS